MGCVQQNLDQTPHCGLWSEPPERGEESSEADVKVKAAVAVVEVSDEVASNGLLQNRITTEDGTADPLPAQTLNAPGADQAVQDLAYAASVVFQQSQAQSRCMDQIMRQIELAIAGELSVAAAEQVLVEATAAAAELRAAGKGEKATQLEYFAVEKRESILESCRDSAQLAAAMEQPDNEVIESEVDDIETEIAEVEVLRRKLQTKIEELESIHLSPKSRQKWVRYLGASGL